MANFEPAETTAVEEEYEPLMPDGYGEGDDIFDPDSWSGGDVDAQSQQAGADGTAANGWDDVDPTTEYVSSDEVSTETNEPTTPVSKEPGILRFKANIDHTERDIELNEAELPTVYQKAQALDRAQRKLERVSPVAAQAERLAKMLGYDSADEMLKTTEESFQNGEIDKLTQEGVHPDVARDLVTRRLAESQAQEVRDEMTEGQRDFTSEVTDLLRSYPDLKGKSLPNEVVSECVRSGAPLVDVYRRYVANREKAELNNLRKENSTLRQNADSASRAPVRSSTRGGPTDTTPDDPFIAGFDSDDW